MNEQKTPFKVGETYKTRGGWNAKVIHIHQGRLGFPVMTVQKEGEDEFFCRVTCDGLDCPGGRSDNDLIPPAKPTVRVPLGPEDVPPGSVFRKSSDSAVKLVTHWSAFNFGTDDGDYPWSNAAEASNWQIKRPGEDWQPMWKEVDDEGGQEG